MDSAAVRGADELARSGIDERPLATEEGALTGAAVVVAAAVEVAVAAVAAAAAVEAAAVAVSVASAAVEASAVAVSGMAASAVEDLGNSDVCGGGGGKVAPGYGPCLQCESCICDEATSRMCTVVSVSAHAAAAFCQSRDIGSSCFERERES